MIRRHREEERNKVALSLECIPRSTLKEDLPGAFNLRTEIVRLLKLDVLDEELADTAQLTCLLPDARPPAPLFMATPRGLPGPGDIRTLMSHGSRRNSSW